MSSLPNADPQIIGTVSPVLTVSSTDLSLTSTGTENVASAEEVLDTVTITYTTERNIGFVSVRTINSGGAATTGILRIRRGGLGGEILDSVSVPGSGTFDLSASDENVSIGVQAYVLTAQRITGTFQLTFTTYDDWNGVTVVDNIGDIQRTHETEVLP